MDYFSSLNASSLDPDIPTLFELLSAHQLNDLISPSIRYILTFYAQRHPQYLLKLANKYDELYSVLMGLVEYYHLAKWNSSFTEKFYGLKRTRVLNTSALRTRNASPQLLETQKRLNKKQILGSLFFIIGLPYIKEKLEARYETLKGRYMFRSIESDRNAVYDDGNWKDKMKFEFDSILLKTYPTISMTNSLVCLAFYLAFLFQKTTASSPADMILGTKFSRLTQFDYARAEQDGQSLSSNSEEDNTPVLQRIANKITTGQGIFDAKDLLLSGFSYALPTSMFLLKFLEWWYSSDFAHQMSKKTRGSNPDDDDNLPVPDSRDTSGKLQLSQLSDKLPNIARKGLCPLCHSEITNPTIIETGVVFCYPCIYRHLENCDREKGGRCPVTGQRLLDVRFNDTTEEWEIGGLRRLML